MSGLVLTIGLTLIHLSRCFKSCTLVGAQGVNGGGWAHYVGQEKLRPAEGWQTIAMAKDWQGPPKLQNGTSFFYFVTDQWRYEDTPVGHLASPVEGSLVINITVIITF